MQPENSSLTTCVAIVVHITTDVNTNTEILTLKNYYIKIHTHIIYIYIRKPFQRNRKSVLSLNPESPNVTSSYIVLVYYMHANPVNNRIYHDRGRVCFRKRKPVGRVFVMHILFKGVCIKFRSNSSTILNSFYGT